MICTAAQLPGQDLRVAHFQQLAAQGNRPSWSVNNIIAYDAPNSSNPYFDVYTMNPDGSNVQCLTCGVATLPPYNKGLPDWHPSGNYFALEVQTVPFPVGGPAYNGSTPGGGYGNDLFIADAAGKNYWQMTNASPDPSTPSGIGGVLHERFSHDGTKILWGQALPGSSGQLYNLFLADFAVTNGVPAISNIQNLAPCASGKYFCEGGTFSLDDSTIFFTGVLDGQPKTGLDIYSYNLNTGVLANLTNSPATWDELPIALPNQNKILWMSGTGDATARTLKSDYWIMDYDGSNKIQVTFYNFPNAVDWNSYIGTASGVASAEEAWSPDGTEFLGEITLDGVAPALGGQLYAHNMQAAAATVSAASFARPPIGQDSIVSSFYTNLASSTQNATGSSLPMNIDGTTASLTDSLGTVRDVPLFFVSPGQVNWLVPSGTATGPATLEITNSQSQSILATIDVEAVGPGLFTATATGQGPAIASLLSYPAGSSQYTLQNAYLNGQLASVSLPGSGALNFLVLYGTGLRHLNAPATVQVGGQTLNASFAGAQGSFDGLDQVNVEIPSSFVGSGVQNVTVTVDGVVSNAVQVMFQ